MKLSTRRTVSNLCLIGVAELVLSGSVCAAATDLHLGKLGSALPDIDNGKKRQVVISLENTTAIDRLANIEITEAQTGGKLDLLPGNYEFRPGYYRVRVYQPLGSRVGHFDENYQITEEFLQIVGSDSGEIRLNYDKPRNRSPYNANSVWSVSLTAGRTFGSYQTPNPVKEHLDRLNVSNTEGERMAYADTGLIGGVGKGASIYGATLTGRNHWMVDYGLDYTMSSTLHQMAASLGTGFYLKAQNWALWSTVGASAAYDRWNVSSYESVFGTTQLNSGLVSYNAYTLVGASPRKGGLFVSLKYAFVNPFVLASVGWNFGAETLNYRLPQVLHLNVVGK